MVDAAAGSVKWFSENLQMRRRRPKAVSIKC